MSAILHDHFDGSARCVECEGKCKLDGAELLLTRIIRCLFGQRAGELRSLPNRARERFKFWYPPMVMDAMDKAGVNVPRFWERAKKAVLS